MVVKELSECGSAQVDCSLMEMFEPLDEKDQLVPVNFWRSKNLNHLNEVLQSNNWILLSITNKMQRYTIFFVTVNAVHVSGGFSTHHQELKNCTHSIRYMPSLLAATASGSSKQAVCTVFELLMMGGETAWKVYSIDSNKEYCITLHHVYAKLGIYPMLCVQFLSSWWWAEKPPETCTAFTVIKNII